MAATVPTPVLTPVAERFVLHWGEMAARWGVNRTVSQIHALLYLAGKPLNAEDIAATLQVARSNVSTSLRELQNWDLVKVVHLLGDRRDHYEAEADLWPQIKESVQRNGQEEAFIAPFFTQLDEVTLALITPGGAQQDDVQFTFRKAS